MPGYYEVEKLYLPAFLYFSALTIKNSHHLLCSTRFSYLSFAGVNTFDFGSA
jgi:hypothetical protein